MVELYFDPVLMIVLFVVFLSLYLGKKILGDSEITINAFKGKKWVLIVSLIFLLKAIVDLLQAFNFF
jgi:hypothetical protein